MYSLLSLFAPSSEASPTWGLHPVLRAATSIDAQASVSHFISLSRQLGVTMLPVTQGGRLSGILTLEDTLSLLALTDEEERMFALQAPVKTLMNAPKAVASPDLSIQEVGRLCAQHKLAEILVVDKDGFCLGVVTAADLLVSPTYLPVPALIGGMATPFGVYLTDGQSQSGAGNLALVSSGMFMGLMYVSANYLVQGGLLLAHRFFHLPYTLWLNPDMDPPPGKMGLGIASVGWQLIYFFLFLLLVRVSRLAGYHAAEHQTVHAIERQEPLVPEVVCRMPRPHPRCGTNLMGGLTIFISLWNLCQAIPALAGSSEIIAGLGTLYAWRRMGTFLQYHLTTRPASPRELASGIAAGQSLLQQFACRPPARPNVLRRFWCMGLLQVAVGTAFVIALRSWLLP